MKLVELILEDANKTVYHGTTQKKWKTIQTQGLTPQLQPDSFFRENASTIKGYTDKNVYLTCSKSKAEYYAEEQAGHDGSSPVVLQLNLAQLDTDKVVPDDDTLAVLMANDLGGYEDQIIERLNSGDLPLSKIDEYIETWRKDFLAHPRHEFAYQGTIAKAKLSSGPS